MSRASAAVLAILFVLPAHVRADGDSAVRVRTSLEMLEPLMAQPSPDWAAFDRGYAALEQAWPSLDAGERAAYEVRRQKVVAFAGRRSPGAGGADQARAALAAHLGLATKDLAGVRDGADLAATLRGLYDGGRISKGTLDAALSAMGSAPGGQERDVRSLLTAFESRGELRGVAFGAAEPPSLDAAAGGVVSANSFDPYFPVKYGPGFDHIDHVNPDAPKGGALRYAYTGKIDTYNPFDWINSATAPGVRGLVIQTLMTGARDNGTSQYGLVARSVEYAKDYSWVQFKLDPRARYSNGAPVTARDVAFSYKAQRASDPYFDKISMKPIVGAQVIDDHTIRFAIKADSPRQAKAAIQTLGGLYVLNEDYYTKNPLGSLGMKTPPLGSGPYVVQEGEQGKDVVLGRNPDYWGKDLPIQKGQYNFDQIRYDRYMDKATARMAFERGDANVWYETDDSQWEALKSRAAAEGFKTETLTNGSPPGFMGLAFNTSKAQFQDPRVRRALSLAMNFPWINKNIFHGESAASTSFFQGTPFAHGASMSDAERKLLAPYGDLPAAVFDPDPNPPLPGDGDAYNRANLKQAMSLLKESGWSVDPKSLELVDGSGQPMRFQIIYQQPTTEKYLLAYAAGLRRLGVRVDLRRYDASSWQHALDHNQYDMVPVQIGASDAPIADWLRDYFGSKSAANEHNSANYGKIRNPAVDALVEKIDHAATQDEWQAAARALDRVLLGESYFIPLGANNQDRLAYRPGLEHEKDLSPYDGFNTTRTWWAK